MANLCPMGFFIMQYVPCFQKQPPLFSNISQIPQQNNCAGVFFLLKMIKLYKDI